MGSRDLALPHAWANFLAVDENKRDLANFLAKKLAVADRVEKRELVMGGRSQAAFSTTRGPIQKLAANHEEADTRLIILPTPFIRRLHQKLWRIFWVFMP